MHLKRIELHGFKTFATRTALELRPGVTSVVGPNGSGKSNIADAVRWALGEANLRHVRCRSTEELIFAGSARRSSVGLAEVSLIFANEGGWLDLPFSEVRVTRRAYRSGENEYLLNGARVRLRDTVDLLAGASIHAGGHVVVGQGMVDAVLAQRPEDRRALVENLAGLKHYYLRRDDAESRLATTEENLLRVDALIAELAPQVAALAAQADTLHAYRAAEDELRALQRASFGAHAARALARSTDAIGTMSRTATDRDAARAQAEQARAEADALATAESRDRAHLEDLRTRLRRETAALSAIRRDVAVATARLAAATEAQHAAEGELALLEGRVAQARAGHDAAREAYTDARTAHDRASAAGACRRQERERLMQARDVALAVHRKVEAEIGDGDGRSARLAHRLALTAARLDGLAGEMQRQKASLATAEESLAATEQALATARQSAQTAQIAHDAARNVEAEAGARLDTVHRAEGAQRQAHQEARKRLDETEGRLRMVREWQEGLEGYDEAVRSLAALPAVRGVAAELLSIPPAYHRAIALALGPLLEAVVTADPVAVLAARGAAGGGAVRLAVISGDPTRGGLPAPREAWETLTGAGAIGQDEICGWAIDLVAAPALPDLGRVLGLDRVLLVRDHAAVLRCRAHLPGLALTVVAADGDLAAFPDGSLVSGSAVRIAGVLGRRQELEALRERQEMQRQAEVEERAALDRARRQSLEAEDARQRALAERKEAESALARARDEVRFQERMLSQAHQTAQGAQATGRRLLADLEAAQQRHGEEERLLAAAQEEQRLRRERLESARVALATAEQGAGEAETRMREEESMLVVLRHRVEAARQLAEERQHALRAAEQDLARRGTQAERSAGEVHALTAAVDDLVTRERAAGAGMARLHAEVRPLEAQLELLARRQADARATTTLATEKLAQAERAHERARQVAETATRELEVLRAQVTAELGCSLEELPAEAPPQGATARMRALREQIASFGLVNARADEDHRTLSERVIFLQTQADDLRTGVSRLRSIIAEANATVRDRFGATVDELHQHFTTFFERLFGGGTCRLIATYDARDLPSGMMVEAQPPGKRTRDMALLSGGERALVALALLFAMLKVRPVPFCLLDEVEAALDESNTGRFGAILRELSACTQFIVITHNRGTMLHADYLYGVTMSETGISAVVSIALARDEQGQIGLEQARS